MDGWTLEYNAQEKTLEDWDILEDFELKEMNKQTHRVGFSTSEDFDAAAGPQFAFDAPAIIRVDGVVVFRGWFESPTRHTSNGEENVRYEIGNVWRFFERHTFQQTRKQFAGWINNDPTQGPILVTVLSSESYLGESPAEEFVTNGEQIQEVINWVNECYNPTRRGATGGIDPDQDIVKIGTIQPKVSHPRGRANTFKCSDVFQEVLRSSPDAVIQFTYDEDFTYIHVVTLAKWNYASTPPVFIDYTNLPEIVVDLTAEEEREMALQAQDLRQLAGVIIKYKTFTQIDGSYWPQMVVDKFPLTVTDYTPEISPHVIAVPGFSLIRMRASVTVRPLQAAFDGDKDWWKSVDKTLDSDLIDQDTIQITGIRAEDDDGVALDLNLFPNQLQSSLPAWAGPRAFQVTIFANEEYRKYKDRRLKTLDEHKDNREVRVRLWATNAITNTYTGVSHFDPGIQVPTGLAEAIYRSVAALQFGGNKTFTANTPRLDIRVGTRVKAIGPTRTFVNLMVQSVSLRPFAGEAAIMFNPSAMPDAEELIELALMSRWRNVEDFPSGRSDGSPGGGTDVNLSADGPFETVSHGVGGLAYDSV